MAREPPKKGGTAPISVAGWCSVVPRGTGLTDLAPVAYLVLTIRTDAWVVDASWGEYSRVRLRYKRPAVLTFRHFSLRGSL